MSELRAASHTIFVMSLLKDNMHKTVDVIAERVGMSARSVYRFIDAFKEMGMKISRRYGAVYTLEDETVDLRKFNMGDLLEKPEAGIILQRPCQDLMTARDTYEAIEKMAAGHHLDDAPYLRQVVANVTLLQIAAQHGRKVTVTYDSNTWKKRKTLTIEPYTFYFYYNYVWCYDCERQRNVPLRVSRMGQVKILDEKWTYGHGHRKQMVDAFGCWGHFTKHVKLRMTMQARNLMTEAHPISMITMKEDTAYPDGERWIVELEVCEYSGLARYIMGMLDEIEILEGEGLKEYIREWREKINAVAL